MRKYLPKFKHYAREKRKSDRRTKDTQRRVKGLRDGTDVSFSLCLSRARALSLARALCSRSFCSRSLALCSLCSLSLARARAHTHTHTQTLHNIYYSALRKGAPHFCPSRRHVGVVGVRIEKCGLLRQHQGVFEVGHHRPATPRLGLAFREKNELWVGWVVGSVQVRGCMDTYMRACVRACVRGSTICSVKRATDIN